jgi:nicotinate-nucleotide adenylyltransferase
MLKLATGRDARFDIDDRELRRAGPSYTYDTLTEIRKERGPDTPLVFLLGSDAFARIATWHRWTELFELAHFAVAIRADDEQWFTKGPGAFRRTSGRASRSTCASFSALPPAR